jgi:recombinational DNA repair ATPase RecF
LTSSHDALHELLFERLVEADLGEPAGQLVLAAYEGDDALTRLDSGQPPPAPASSDPDVPSEPPGMYLKTIHVEGFRGIGAPAALHLTPGPGLTLVTGRNGSGKSSFAEALELALTGHNWRWEGRTVAWREGWRNLHHPEATQIGVDIVTEGHPGTTAIRRDWGDTANLPDGQWTLQPSGKPREQYDNTDWESALRTYRPFLSYSELGTLIEGRPSDMYDALQGLLGLDRLVAADKRLNDRRKRLEDIVKNAKGEAQQVRQNLGSSTDERVERARELLAARIIDVPAVTALATGETERDGRAAPVRDLAHIGLPPAEEVAAAAEEVRTAVTALAELGDTQSATARRVADLLTAATAHHDITGDAPCPVCRSGLLDAAWHIRAAAEVRALRAQAETADAAHTALDSAVRIARQLATPPPAALRGPQAGLDVAPALDAWQVWSDAARIEDPMELASALPAARDAAAGPVAQLQQAAVQALDRLDDEWKPIASRLAAWTENARKAHDAAPRLTDVKAAIAWLRTTTQVLRDERLAPFAKLSADVWEQLRQESNVQLGPVRLEGSSTKRRVALDVSVDGIDGAALAVMSQGELHALALALFLPRATVAESPFRFVVIDDPVQAMDPSKVEGLARVLADVSRRRQVVVFTHDDRLPEAVRRLDVPATIWEVSRRENSVIELKKNLDPVARYLDDARAIASTTELPDDLRSVLVPAYCRSAIEAACQTAVRARRLGRGDQHTNVELALGEARTTHQLMAMALFDDVDKGADVLPYLNKRVGHWAGTVLQACKTGAHRPHAGDLHALITDSRRLADTITA